MNKQEFKDEITTGLIGIIFLILGIIMLMSPTVVVKVIGGFCICTFIVFEFFVIDNIIDYLHRNND